MTCALEARRRCTERAAHGFVERPDPDSGELLSPGYKLPWEVEGVLTHAWSACAADYSWRGYDLFRLLRPLEWALYKAPSGRDEVLVLAPRVVPGGVFGIEHRRENASALRFLATPRRIVGAARLYEAAQGSASFDRLVGDAASADVPTWGVLYRCARSNLVGASAAAETARDRTRRCLAATTLQAHAQRLSTSLRDAVVRAALPAEMAAQLARLRVWPSDASVDLAQSAEVWTAGGAGPEAVCILTVAELATEHVADCVR